MGKSENKEQGTDMATLPEGTQFTVVNGAWYGEIVIKDGEKCVNAYDDPPGIKDRKLVSCMKLGPEGDPKNINMLHNIILPQDNVRSPKEMKVKIVIQDGIVMGVFMNSSAEAMGLKIDIVDADSEYDTEEAVRRELNNPGMIEIKETLTRHPE